MEGSSISKNPRDALKVGISANLGWGFELFDLVVYLYAATIIAPLFFPSTSYMASVLEALFALISGYFARPIGAVIFGHYGDRLGRKTVWFVSLLGMGIITIAIGFLPTYAAIGVAAPAILIILRIIQGIFLAGEWGGGMTLVVEAAPDNRRGLYGGVQQGGAALGLIFAVAATYLAEALAPGPLMATLGWRILFWFGAIPLIIALAVRWEVGESVEWLAKAKPKIEKLPIATVFRKYWKFVAIATVTIFGESLLYYGGVAYMPTALALFTHLGVYQIANTVLVTNIVWYVLAIPFGYSSDILRSRKKLLASIYIITAVLAYPLMILLISGSYGLALLSGAILGALFAYQYSILPAWLGENIPAVVRYSFTATVINLGVAFSSFAPYISTYLSTFLPSVTAMSIVLIIGAIAAVIFVLIGPKDRVHEPLI